MPPIDIFWKGCHCDGGCVGDRSQGRDPGNPSDGRRVVNMMRRAWILALLPVALAPFVALMPAAVAAYPDRPITLIVAYEKGGSTDLLARMLVPFIERRLGGSARIDVVNRPGATGEVGFATLAAAAPDGYTLGFLNAPGFQTIPIERRARYAPEQIELLVNVVDDPCVWTVPEDSPFGSVQDVIAFARDNPNIVTVGTTGVGSDEHLSGLQIQRRTRISLIQVHFQGGAPNHRAMLSKRIMIAAQNLGEALRARATDRVRILGVMSAQRHPDAQDVPTFREQGLNVTMSAMRAVGAPVGMPAEIRSELVAAIVAAAEDPGFLALARVPDTYQPVRVLGPAEATGEFRDTELELRALWADSPWNVR